MKLTVYGTSQSRTIRVLWMLNELNIDFHHVPIDWRTCAEDSRFLKINPAGMVPCIVDGEFVVTESLAINLYLARKFQKLWPDSLEDQSRILQWTLWSATSIESHYIQWADHTEWLLKDRRKPDLAAVAMENLRRPLDYFETILTDRQWLIGDSFSVADLNVAAMIELLGQHESLGRPGLTDWLDRCLSRPAFIKASSLP